MITIDPISFELWHTDKAAFAQKLGRSFRETGFAIVCGHTIDDVVIAKADAAAEAFFELDDPIKRQYVDAQDGYQRGYSPFMTENAKGRSQADLKEFWHRGRLLPAHSPYRSFMKGTPQIAELPQFDPATLALFEALDSFGEVLLRAVALYLNLDEHWFDDKVDAGNSILRLLHYPPQTGDIPEGGVRAGAHEDINLITLLLGAEEAGLQALHRSGIWLDVNAPKGSIVVNCGDMLQRLTAGILPSTTHRVLNPAPERARHSRYSKPFFLHPNGDFVISALPGCIAQGGTAEPDITAKDYLDERLRDIGLKA